MRFDNLPAWLSWQENLHFTEVDPGLDRISRVWDKLGGKTKLPFTVVTVAGTNGKGSSVAMLASILKQAGYQVGTYTSPHLLRYNERICINALPCDDSQICEAFERIDQARGDISLTYFEFATLAAALIFLDSELDIAIFEVGMGGRLDAVNLFDADIALITPIGIDHTQWLGNNREQIAREKAGVFRRHQEVVCSEHQPANSLLEHARQLDTNLHVAGQDFDYEKTTNNWSWHNKQFKYDALMLPKLLGDYQLQNASAVLQVISLLVKQGHEIAVEAIQAGLQSVELAGRFQQIKTASGLRIFDVTHNHQGACNLATVLQQYSGQGKTYALLAMLADKDVESVVTPLAEHVDFWFLSGLDGSRGMSANELATSVKKCISEQKIQLVDDVESAYQLADSHLSEQDRMIVFGSFHTVEAVMRSKPELF